MLYLNYAKVVFQVKTNNSCMDSFPPFLFYPLSQIISNFEMLYLNYAKVVFQVKTQQATI